MGKQLKIFDALIAMTILLCFAGRAAGQQHQLRIKAGYWYYGDFPYYPTVAIEKLVTGRLSLSINGLIFWRPGITDQDRFFDWASSLQTRYYLWGKPQAMSGLYAGGNLQLEQIRGYARTTKLPWTRTQFISAGIATGIQLPIFRRFSFQCEAGLLWTILGQRKIYGITGEFIEKQTVLRPLSPQLSILFSYSL